MENKKRTEAQIKRLKGFLNKWINTFYLDDNYEALDIQNILDLLDVEEQKRFIEKYHGRFDHIIDKLEINPVATFMLL